MAFQWHPALLAREVATVDALTGGLLELGLGTGYVQSEHDRAGLPFGPAGERVDHLRHTVEETDRLLSAEDHDGLHRGAGTARAVRLHVSDSAGGVHGGVRTAGRYRRSRRRRVSGWWNSGCRAVSRDGIAV
ncbi:hypothetical protein DWG14_07222 [Streptomyces griseorubiginosus]|uniref:Luciferase-like domain-containing protein n=1 Tax=Streptomyces griseorubiginosus TaxID=67304 RepID=A0AAI8L7G6_9ACTN|nr:hypothetical protein DWG14_07222 [Streptomyces griseorubiginosus]